MDILPASRHFRPMQFAPPLVSATLDRRYKRFLADCRLADGGIVTAHCPNPGSMLGLATPGTKTWLQPNDDPKKKLKYGWRLVEHESDALICVDTSLANRITRDALMARDLPALAGYTRLRAEVPYGEASRVDFLLTAAGLPDAWLEVKSVTLCRRPGIAEFPDAVTARGAKHMRELAAMAKAGDRAAVLFAVQRTDATEMRVAGDIDPAYAAALKAALRAGVEVIAHRAEITPETIALGPVLPFVPPA